MKLSILATILGLFTLCFTQSFAQAQKRVLSTGALLVSPSNFKLLAANVSYQGEKCSPSDQTDKIYNDTTGTIRVGEDTYYESYRYWSSGRGDGLIKENFYEKTCRVFRISDLAEAAGWSKNADNRNKVPDSTMGLFRVGKSLWMGSNGIGVAVFDLERETWSRFDLKSAVIAGDHLVINYADDDYVFVTRGEFPGALLHVYSVKQNKWLGLKSVSTKLVREYGYTTGMVQVPVNHGMFAKADYIPIDWTFMGLTATLINNGQTYLFEKKFSETKTVFEISKSQLEQTFLKN
ncbi:MAG TPA: hypothetical protein VF540_11955 [Segetibacter sp.]|jgi:hypothetical protein